MGLFKIFKGKDENQEPKNEDNSLRYVPGQKEPSEYIEYVAAMENYYKEADPFSFPLLIFGFDNESVINKITNDSKKKGLHGAIDGVKSFTQRNPVIKLKYPLWFQNPQQTYQLIIKDATILKKNGSTDLSAVGINMDTALQLRNMYGEKCCVRMAIIK
jgi:hypothetical protein